MSQRPNTPPITAVGDGGRASGGPVPPRRGMLGPFGEDEFDPINGWRPPAKRSQVDDFNKIDAASVLDGDVGPIKSRQIAAKVKAGLWDAASDQDGKLPHGGHRFSTGWGKDEFPPAWRERDVIEWVRAIVDKPMDGHSEGRGFMLSGTHNGVSGEIHIAATGEPGIWYIATAYPTGVQLRA